MSNLKNYACHRVYEVSGHYQSQSVVTITEEGEVTDCKPLSQEIPFTEWIGGIIMLSPDSKLSLPIDFKKLRQQTTKGKESSPLYAWYISDFNFQKEVITLENTIRRLPFYA